ncbi:MAG: Na+/H+ antiporter NhaC family protein, partial [Planctomycetaceae bacterium]
MRRILLLLVLPAGLCADARAANLPRYRVKVPATVLTDVPVKFVRIEALRYEGKTPHVDTAYQGTPLITGVMYTVQEPKSGREVDKALGAFQNGVLELVTELKPKRMGGDKSPTIRKVYIIADEIIVDPNGRDRTVVPVKRTNRWWSIVPPVLAVVLAVLLRNVLLAMFAGVWGGAAILARGDVIQGFVNSLEVFLLDEIARRDGDGQYGHLLIVLFTMFLGAMIGVMARAGGTRAVVASLARFTTKREHAQVMTWTMGFAIFFDDYANTLLVGSTMRPVTDRLKISREKLAFLVDSTAAPVAGLAVISTWVGIEVSYINDTYKQLFTNGEEWNAYSTFIATIPFRFYALHLLVFVLLIAYSGHDFGPMLRAEARTLRTGDLGADPTRTDVDDDSASPNDSARELLRTALIPLVVLIGAIAGGLSVAGAGGGASTRVMFFSAFLASVSAVMVAVVFRCLSLQKSLEAWISGAKSMFTACIVLVMAWAIATVCNPDNLNTAGFLVELAGGRVSAMWVPAIAFLLAAVISLATGSSFSTMGLLMPLFITMTYYLLANENDVDPNHHLMLATIGAVLAGSIFGDHCSPISDTTVLSSAATGCDHLRHVATQMPYALSIAGIALLLGYLPVGFGLSPLILLPLGLIAMYLLVQFVGQPAAEFANTLPESHAVVRESPAEDARETPPDEPQRDQSRTGEEA